MLGHNEEVNAARPVCRVEEVLHVGDTTNK